MKKKIFKLEYVHSNLMYLSFNHVTILFSRKKINFYINKSKNIIFIFLPIQFYSF